MKTNEELEKENAALREDNRMLLNILECARSVAHIPDGKEHYALDEAIRDYDDHSGFKP